MGRPPFGASKRGTIWTTDAAGSLVKHDVRIGLTDGTRTQVDGQGLDAGAKIVIGTIQPGSTPAATTTTKNPLQGQTTGGGRGGPPGPF